MTSFTAPYEEVRQDFIDRGIAIDGPGFYDDPRFLKAEQRSADFLNNYARFVQERPRDAAYDAHVRRVAPVVAAAFHQKLVENGRLGACIDISILLSRALEREGIWNFIAKGSLTITFPPASGIGPRYYWTIDERGSNFSAAHAWVVAPPFFVIDVSIQQQPFKGKEASYLPPFICDDALTIAESTNDDIIAPVVRRDIARRGILEAQALRAVNPRFPPFLSAFPARLVTFEQTTLKYIPCAMGAPDAPFEETTNMSFNGKTGFEVYRDEIREQIEQAK